VTVPILVSLSADTTTVFASIATTPMRLSPGVPPVPMLPQTTVSPETVPTYACPPKKPTIFVSVSATSSSHTLPGFGSPCCGPKVSVVPDMVPTLA